MPTMSTISMIMMSMLLRTAILTGTLSYITRICISLMPTIDTATEVRTTLAETQ